MYNYILKRIEHNEGNLEKVKDGKLSKSSINMSLGALVELQFLIDYTDLTTIERNELRHKIRLLIEDQ